MNQHFHLQHDDDGIAWLAFDKADSGTNVLTEDTLEAFDRALIGLAQSHPKALVIYSGKNNGFIAGADVKAFAKITSREAAEKHIRRVHEIFYRLESLAFPTVALIHGFCLGGGLELSLACNYRIARDDEGTRLGFPEVKLGIFPGYGGTVRSTHLIGHIPALKLMLTGRTISGRAAKHIGLVDQAVPERQLRNAARQIIQHQPHPRHASLLQQIPGFAPFRPLVAAFMNKQVTKKTSPNHYPAPFDLIKHWRRNAGDTPAMYSSEAREVARLINADSAQQLIRVFLLQDHLKSLGDKKDFMPQHVHVIGGGVMGGDIAAWCALRGMRVTLQDRAPKYLGKAIARAHTLFKRKLKNRYLVQKAVDRLMPDHLGLGVPQADVVIEAIYENLDAKKKLYDELEPRLKEGALLATNTSSIPLTELSTDLGDPTRLVGLHFFNPVAMMPLLEIVIDQDTSPHAIKQATAFSRHIDKLPLPVLSSPGFLVNRVLMPYLLEAVKLFEEGISGRVIDYAATEFGMPMGPIELADTVGLDVCLSVAEKMSAVLGNEVPGSLRTLVKAGKYGKKTGDGFYHWHKGKAIKPKGGQTSNIEELADRLIMRLVNESVACLREGVVDDADLLDAGIIFGTGFAPFRGGPMHYIHTKGTQQCQKRMNELELHYGKHFHADEGWGSVA